MRCPFLREAQVKFCCASEYKKLIARYLDDTSDELCTSPAYVNCQSARDRHEELPSLDHCPFLQETLCQYCSVMSVVKYVPYQEPGLTRCGTSAHRYCELMMTMQNPRLLTPHDVIAPEIDPDDENASGYWMVDGIQTVGWLFYSPNHMWADVDEDGTCHVGADAFMSKVLGKVDDVTFASSGAARNPAVSLSVNGLDLQMIFPEEMRIYSTNPHLRSNPSKVTSDPYTLGWLFEGKLSGVPRGLIRGKASREWMRDEMRRLVEFAQDLSANKMVDGIRMMADGGMIDADFLGSLTKEELLLLYNDFFSPRQSLSAEFGSR